MRTKLLQIALSERVYKLSPRDMDVVINLVSKIIEERARMIEQIRQKMERSAIDLVEDILDDVWHYHFSDHVFLWESCVWRLQGIFEGILDERFLPEQDYRGLSHRLSVLKKQGYIIPHEEELMRWSQFRNALSHSPPKEQLNGPRVYLGREDLVELREFLVIILRDLELQKKLLSPDAIP